MPSKEERQAEAKKHIALMKSVFSAETDAAIKSAKFYEDGEGRELPIPEPRFEATATEVTTDFMVTALYKHKGTVALVDPAAFSKPAGDYEEGSFGPEQALCSESNLYPVLSGLKKEYYDKNRGFASGQIYNDHAMYLSDVTFTRRSKRCRHAHLQRLWLRRAGQRPPAGHRPVQRLARRASRRVRDGGVRRAARELRRVRRRVWRPEARGAGRRRNGGRR